MTVVPESRTFRAVSDSSRSAKLATIPGFLIAGLLSVPLLAAEPDLTKLSIEQVCARIRRGDTAALEEIVRRGTFDVTEVGYIAGRKIFIGMTEGAAYCATGRAEKVNKTTTVMGVSLQVILKDGRYVYIENGKVTAIQE